VPICCEAFKTSPTNTVVRINFTPTNGEDQKLYFKFQYITTPPRWVTVNYNNQEIEINRETTNLSFTATCGLKCAFQNIPCTHKFFVEQGSTIVVTEKKIHGYIETEQQFKRYQRYGLKTDTFKSYDEWIANCPHQHKVHTEHTYAFVFGIHDASMPFLQHSPRIYIQLNNDDMFKYMSDYILKNEKNPLLTFYFNMNLVNSQVLQHAFDIFINNINSKIIATNITQFYGINANISALSL
jgi:hypothetical protein